jgi:hypothetical protein
MHYLLSLLHGPSYAGNAMALYMQLSFVTIFKWYNESVWKFNIGNGFTQTPIPFFTISY